MITQLNHLPEGILDVTADQLHTKVSNHTLVHLEGKIKQPVFISILQHGDEYTGWDALKAYLIDHLDSLPRSISILFGNIEAAKHNVRQLEGQPDFNRSWPSHLKLDDPVAKTMQEITDIMKKRNPFASVDIHNNSGRNPHYSGINCLDQTFVNMASLFSDTMIYFTNPYGIQSGAFAKICPSVTVECGLSGTSNGIDQTQKFIDLLLKKRSLSEPKPEKSVQKIYKIFATVKLREDIDFGFDDKQLEFSMIQDLDHLNFRHCDKGQVFGYLSIQLSQKNMMPFIVTDQNDKDITAEYFAVDENRVICHQAFVPAMITQKVAAIKHDCLCYIMKPISLQKN